MKNFCILLVLLCIPVCLMGQDYKLKLTLSVSAANFTTDPIGNLYVYDKGDITKYNVDGREIARFSTREFGNITYLDASNPLKVVAIFKEFSKAIILDASLAEQARIELSFPGIPFVNVICSSREQGYWIVDPVAKQIKKMNDQLQITQEGTPLRQITDQEMSPDFMIDSGNWLVVHADGYGLMVFDRFGTYYKTIAVQPPGIIQAAGHDILFKDKTGMVKVDIKTGKIDHFLLPDNNPDDLARVEGNRIFIKTENSIKIFTY